MDPNENFPPKTPKEHSEQSATDQVFERILQLASERLLKSKGIVQRESAT